jgi:hypothetical protein
MGLLQHTQRLPLNYRRLQQTQGVSCRCTRGGYSNLKRRLPLKAPAITRRRLPLVSIHSRSEEAAANPQEATTTAEKQEAAPHEKPRRLLHTRNQEGRRQERGSTLSTRER